MRLSKHWATAAGCLALLSASLAPAQTSSAKTTPGDDFTPTMHEFDLFAGGQLFHKRSDPEKTKLLNATIFGAHVTQNIWRYWSLEESLTGSTLADLTLIPIAGQPPVDLEQRVWKLSFNPVYHFTPNGSRFRPFLTMGFTEAIYHATKDGKLGADLLYPVPAPTFDSSHKAALNYGAGFKYRFTDLLGMRVDVRGLWSGAPTWRLPNSNTGLPAGALFIPNRGSLNGMEATAGIVFNIGRGKSGGGGHKRVFELSPIEASPTSGNAGDTFTFRTTLTDSAHAPNIIYNWTVDGVAQSATGPELRTTLSAGKHEIRVTATDPKTHTVATAPPYPITVGSKARVFELSPLRCSPNSGYVGEAFTCNTRLTDSANAPNIRYTWTVDGVEQSGATGPNFRFTNLGTGTHQIKVTATDPATGTTASTGAYTVTVNPVPPLTITGVCDKTEIKAGETARCTAQSTETAYSGALRYTWNTNVGSISGSGSSVTFDSSSVPFDPANVFKPESRTATITPTVTDQRGRTATGSPIQIRVNKDPKAMRLDDLIFGKGSARVNNCAKRILIDELQGLLNNNPDVEVLLIGHVDAAEAKILEHQRVYNAAAVLTAGTGVCAKCDLARIKVAFAGSDQSSDFRAGFCGTSTRQKSDERKADAIAADDAAAKNRRVEIWIVPKGVATPGGAKNPQPAPVRIIKARGCPR